MADDASRGGGCLCGAVRYTVTGPPLLTAICHCRHCQRQSGSAFSVNLVVADAQFAAQGEMRVFDDWGDSGEAVHRHFCAACGSPIVSIADAFAGLTIIKAGTLDDPGSVVPTQEAYCRDAWAIVPRLDGTDRFQASNIGAPQ